MMVRMATDADMPDLIALGAGFHGRTVHADFAAYDPARFERYCRHLMTSERCALWIGDKAMLAASLAQHPASHAVYAHEIFLYSEGAKQALGLLRALKAWALEKGAARVIVSDQMNMKSLDRLYERVGAKPFERHYIMEAV
jgi:hypothetical protein